MCEVNPHCLYHDSRMQRIKKDKNAKVVEKVYLGFINELTDYNFNQVSVTKCNLSGCIVFFFAIEVIHRHQPVRHESETN